MTWFEKLTGIDEESPEQVRRMLSVDDDCIVCPDGKRIAFGRLEMPTLGELRSAVTHMETSPESSTVREVVGDVGKLHAAPTNENALFQVASQFNLLEMASPSVTPERGVGIYERDHTQGPACAIACGSGTIYRNYFAPVGDGIGQSETNQIDCSSDLGQLLGNARGQLWKMQNGYLFPTNTGLDQISTKLQLADEVERDRYRGSLRIGLQWNSAVTLPGASHRVSQAYCSALPVAYGRQRTEKWTDFARLVLEAAYEATVCAAIMNRHLTGSSTLFLTLLGGGVFGNRDEWITDAIERAVTKYRDHKLDIAIVSYGSSKPAVTNLASRLN